MNKQNQTNVENNRGPLIMIHTCNAREWYVYDFLLPSLVKQGIDVTDIKVWHDYERLGNLKSFVASMKWVRQNCDPASAIWHLQDDIVISKNFKQEIEKEYQGVACGFVCADFNAGILDKTGRTPARNIWFSFPCIRIPNYIAGQFYDWFYEEALNDDRLWKLYKENKHDDDFFRTFIKQKYNRSHVFNMNPNIVEHVDYMIGWSVCNGIRGKEKRGSAYWQDHNQVSNLARALKEAGKYVY